MLKENIDYQCFAFGLIMGGFSGGLPGNDGGTRIHGQIGTHAGDIHRAAVGDDPGINCAMAIMEVDAGRTQALTRIVITLTRPVSGNAGQSTATGRMAGARHG